MQNMHVCDMLYLLLLLFENMSSQQSCKCWGLIAIEGSVLLLIYIHMKPLFNALGVFLKKWS